MEENVVKKIIKKHIQELDDFTVDNVKVYQKSTAKNHKKLTNQKKAYDFKQADLDTDYDDVNFEDVCEICYSESNENILKEKIKKEETKIEKEAINSGDKDMSTGLIDMSLF